ncbi:MULTISPECIES: hypothetical protein [Halomonadaceae]|uniref:hypothetical protein n=1 Tax=Halomonadaceae TaxID=28256 RepID=UPI001598B979|nr:MULTISPECIES: hypothetical protein [Halomonas]QJQ95968.1 hypothetical protein HIO72_12310 [Halomonas sp. PA5]
MSYQEAHEHAKCRLHAIFTDPYSAFDNDVLERKLHLDITLKTLLELPLTNGRLRLQVIHGWENGAFDPGALQHSEHPVSGLDDIHEVTARYKGAFERSEPLPDDGGSLLSEARDEAIAQARRHGQAVDAETRENPARWPAFEKGLTLYTLFKVYHRLTYGEDESYRSILCEMPEGQREIHEFHLEECEFALCVPSDTADAETAEESLLILHESQLEPMIALLDKHLGAGR